MKSTSENWETKQYVILNNKINRTVVTKIMCIIKS